jgi:phage-related protein (TIGR01555 family)
MARKKQPIKTVKTDGVENILTGLGRHGRDANTATTFRGDILLDQSTLEGLYSSSGIARRLIDMIPDESLKKGIDCDEELYTELERLDAFKQLANLSKDARLYGGAIMLLLAKDGEEDLAMPLREAGLKRIERLAVFDRFQCLVTADDYDNDAYSESFGEVKTYSLHLKNGQYLKVHASRVIRLDGDRLPTTPFQNNAYWHASSLQGAYTSILSYLSAQGFSDIIIKEWGLTILKVQGLHEAYTNGLEAKISGRLNDANVSKSLMNMILMDADSESFERQFSNVTGYSDLMLRTMELVSANSGIPMTKLFGRSPEGMNATGEGDQKQWGAVVQAYQMQSLQPAINRLVYLLSLQSEWTENPDDLSWNFPSVTTLDDLELAEIRYKNAQADALYIAQGAIDPTYLWHIRHEGGYNINPSYSLESLEEYESETMGRMEETPQTSESV